MLGLRLILGACLVGICAAHVRLTFPPARTFALDFLDNVRTAGPCGMESSPDGPVTLLSPGTTFNVTWHLAYSHVGGYRLEILDRNDNSIVSLLTPDSDGDYYNVNDTTTQSQEVTIPASLAEGAYTFRLVRQAAEWVTANASVPYIFWSCADVNVTSMVTCDGGQCLNGGTCQNSQCTCVGLYSGRYCQYKDECTNEADCNDNGDCVDLGVHTYPRRQCFCDPGFFGIKCVSENPSGFSDPTNYDLSGHFQRDINDRYRMYYKILPESGEIEIAIDVMSTTWVGFGWRPLGINGSCQNWPVIYNTGSPLGEPESEPEAEATPTPAAGRRRRSPHEVRVRVVRDNHDDNQDDDQQWQCVPGQGPVPEGEPEPETTGEPEGEATPEPEPAGEPEPTGEPEGEPEPGSRLHPMDCMDIVIGMVINNQTRIHDYYTRDRSTPRLDGFYGGMESLTAAMGVQWDNGWTRVIFRKSLQSNEMTDHSIADNAPMMTIWARGQEFGRYFHNPPSGLERCQATDYMFYRRDELKYHGTNDQQRGLIPNLNFYVDPNARADGPCFTEEVVEDPTCQGPACDYRLTIEYMADTDSYDLTVTTPLAMDSWTGVAFSSNGAMVGSDAILMWMDGATGIVMVKDYTLNGKSAAMVVEDGNVGGMTILDSSYQNGVLSVKVNRLRNTGDSNDFAFTDEDGGCAMLLMPRPGSGSGPVTNGNPQYHRSTPMVSSRTCIRSCSPMPTVGDGGGTNVKPLRPLAFILSTLAVFLFSSFRWN